VGPARSLLALAWVRRDPAARLHFAIPARLPAARDLLL